jgi:hypothetical protein
MAESTKPRPPWTVTGVVVLIYIAGILDIVLGVVLIFLRYTTEAGQGGLQLSVTLMGAATILIGLAILGVASALFRGSTTARGLVTMFVMLAFVLDLISYLFDVTAGPAVLIQQAVFDVVILALLWSASARRYFDRTSSASTRLA